MPTADWGWRKDKNRLGNLTRHLYRPLQTVVKSWQNMATRDIAALETVYEPRHDKTNKMSVRPAKTQISLGIRQV